MTSTLIAIAVLLVCGLPYAGADVNPKQSTVVIDGERFSGISEVSLSDDVNRIRVIHDSGVRAFDIAKVPKDFLDSWKILSKREQVILEKDPTSKSYIYETNQLRTQVRNVERGKVIAALGSPDFTVTRSYSLGALGEITLSKELGFIDVYKGRRIRELVLRMYGIDHDLLAREYNVLLVGYTMDSAAGFYRADSVAFGDLKPSGLTFVESGSPGGRGLYIYRDDTDRSVYELRYVAVRPKEPGRKLNAIFKGPFPSGDQIVLTFDRSQLVAVENIFEKWKAAADESLKENKDTQSVVGTFETPDRRITFTHRYTAEGKHSVLRLETTANGQTLLAEVPLDAFEFCKECFRDSDSILRESDEFWKDRP